MPRILIGEWKQETATFNPWRTTYDDFRVRCDDDLLPAYAGTKTELAGACEVFDSAGDVEIVPTCAAAAVSGGPIEESAIDRCVDAFLDRCRAAGHIDAACFCLHGAMAGEREMDPEGRLLAGLRELLGNKPIVASLDLHAVLTQRMIDAADVLVPFHTYPHVDQYETGQRAARCLLRLLAGGVRPVVARVELPMLVRGDELITATGRFGDAIRRCRDVEADSRGLAAGVIIGNAFTDVPELQSNVLITSDGAAEWAAGQCREIGRFMWEHRRHFRARLISLGESIRIAEQTAGLTVFSDAADATASGASGDSNAILRGLLAHGFQGTALVPIVDGPAAARAFGAGVGATLDLVLGGTRDRQRFQPLPVRAIVKSLHDGDFRYEDGTAARGGRTAVLAIGAIRVLVTSRSVYVVGRRVFTSHGLDPRDFDVVVVKSPNGFRTWYESIAQQIVPVDVPGSTSANLPSLPFARCVRPIFPLDDEVAAPLVPRVTARG